MRTLPNGHTCPTCEQPVHAIDSIMATVVECYPCKHLALVGIGCNGLTLTDLPECIDTPLQGPTELDYWADAVHGDGGVA